MNNIVCGSICCNKAVKAGNFAGCCIKRCKGDGSSGPGGIDRTGRIPELPGEMRAGGTVPGSKGSAIIKCEIFLLVGTIQPEFSRT